MLGRNYSKAVKYENKNDPFFSASNHESSYSSLNMGSGEDVVFDILHLFVEAKNGSLIIIEEIETGLHPKAQKELMIVIQEISLKKQLQVILTTHSIVILQALPPEGRILLTRVGNQIKTEYEVSPEYAFSVLAMEPSRELVIYTEDVVGKDLLLELLPVEIKNRVNITYVGSWTIVLSQQAAFYRDRKLGKCLALFDGDCKQKNLPQKFHNQIENLLDKSDYAEWFKQHTDYFPSEEPPEKWLMQFREDNMLAAALATKIKGEPKSVLHVLSKPAPKDAHDFFYGLSQTFGLNEESIRMKYLNVFVNCTQISLIILSSRLKISSMTVRFFPN